MLIEIFLFLLGIILMIPIALCISVPMFQLVRLIYYVVNRKKDTKANAEDKLVYIAIILSFILTVPIVWGEEIASRSMAPSESESLEATVSYNYEDFSKYETLPPLYFYDEPFPTINLDDFDFLEEPSLSGEGIPFAFITYPESAHRNEEVVVRIKGKPYTQYSIIVTYSSGTSTADGLYPKYSDSEGYVSWRWKIGGRTSFGTYPITVSGGGANQTVYFDVDP